MSHDSSSLSTTTRHFRVNLLARELTPARIGYIGSEATGGRNLLSQIPLMQISSSLALKDAYQMGRPKN